MSNSSRKRDRGADNAASAEAYAFLAQRSVLRHPSGGCFAEKMLRLAEQLEETVSGYLSQHPEAGDNEDDSIDAEFSRGLLSEIDSLRQLLEDETKKPRRSIALLGQNGDGKSTTLNLMAQVTEVGEWDYGLNALGAAEVAETDDPKLRQWLFQNLEGVQEFWMQCCRNRKDRRAKSSFWEIPKERVLSSIVFASRDKLRGRGRDVYFEKEARTLEKEKCIPALRKAYERGKPKPREMSGFILPAASGGKATSMFSVRVARGGIYHAVILYRPEAEIRNELAEFDWDGLKDDMPDENASAHAKYKRDMLHYMAGKDPGECADLSSTQVEFPNSPEEVQICARVKALLDKGVEIISGRGRKLLDDRLWVREKLKGVVTDTTVAFIAADCRVYVPCDAFDGLELVDTPGAGTDSAVEQSCLKTAVKSADGVLVVQQRELKDRKEVSAELKASEVLRRMIEDPQDYPLFMLTAMDERSSFSDLSDVQHDLESMVRDASERKKGNENRLRQLLHEEFDEMLRKDSVPEGAEKEECVRQVLEQFSETNRASRPMLWASATLSYGELSAASQRPQYAVAMKQAMSYLDDVGCLISAIRLWARRKNISKAEELCRTFLERFEKRIGKAARKEGNQYRPPEAILLKAAEEKKTTFKNRKEQSENLKVQYDRINRRMKELFDENLGLLEGHLNKMVKRNAAAQIVKTLSNDILKNQQKFKTFQYAFDRKLEGRYKKMELFRVFFRDVQMPSVQAMEADIEKTLRDGLVKLLREFMVEVVEDILGSGLQLRRGRNKEPMDPDVLKLITKAVHASVPLPDETPSNAVEEALGLLTKFISKRKIMNRGIFDNICRECLKTELINHVPARHQGKKLNQLDSRQKCEVYIKVVREKTEGVLEEVKEMVKDTIVEGVDETLNEIKKRFTEKKPKGSGLPVLFKLYRKCFGKLFTLGGGCATEERGEYTLKTAQAIKEEFREMLEAVKAEDIPTTSDCTTDTIHAAFIESMQTKQAVGYLVQQLPETLPHRIQTQRQKVGKKEPKPLDAEHADKVAKKMQGTKKKDHASLRPTMKIVENMLRGEKLELGEAAGDHSCLFNTLAQLITGTRDPLQEMAQDLRQSFVTVVQHMHQSAEAKAAFELRWGVSVQEWARDMLRDDAWGDAPIIDAFAAHFDVHVRVYTPWSSDGPIQFPLPPRTLKRKSRECYRIAHVPFGDGQHPNHYVPVWPMRISVSPRTQVRKEPKPDREQESKHSTPLSTAKPKALAAAAERNGDAAPPSKVKEHDCIEISSSDDDAPLYKKQPPATADQSGKQKTASKPEKKLVAGPPAKSKARVEEDSDDDIPLLQIKKLTTGQGEKEKAKDSNKGRPRQPEGPSQPEKAAKRNGDPVPKEKAPCKPERNRGEPDKREPTAEKSQVKTGNSSAQKRSVVESGSGHVTQSQALAKKPKVHDLPQEQGTVGRRPPLGWFVEW